MGDDDVQCHSFEFYAGTGAWMQSRMIKTNPTTMQVCRATITMIIIVTFCGGLHRVSFHQAAMPSPAAADKNDYSNNKNNINIAAIIGILVLY
jgi:hypothetical protein